MAFDCLNCRFYRMYIRLEVGVFLFEIKEFAYSPILGVSIRNESDGMPSHALII